MTAKIERFREIERRALWLVLIGSTGLALLGLAYQLSHEPAPRVRVLWRQGVTPDQRAALESKFLLRNPREPFAEGSLAYDLLDTSRSNLRAMVEEPLIADTDDIDRNDYVVNFETEYGGEWMWVAHRLPVLRYPWPRAVVVVVLVAMVVVGLNGVRRARYRGQGSPLGPNAPVV
jgi:hypothetical protein